MIPSRSAPSPHPPPPGAPPGRSTPFDRELWRGNRLAATWLQRQKARLAPGAPAPAPKALLGTEGWDRFRAADLARRHPTTRFPPMPSVPLPRLSAAGRAWAAAVRTTLHLRLETELLADPFGYAAVEANPAALLAHVDASLPEVLLEAGMVQLPLVDLAALRGDPAAPEVLALVAGVVLAVRGQLG